LARNSATADNVICNQETRRTPDPAHISTIYIERQNLTMRMAIRRFTRLTNAFSKKLGNLRAACALHFAYYNFCRIHKSLRVTPAMQANIAERIWTLQEFDRSAEYSGEYELRRIKRKNARTKQ
jgi:hypothetical protein